VKTAARCLAVVAFLLVISLSTGTASACGLPTPTEITVYNPLGYECWGDGSRGSYPVGCNLNFCSSLQGGPNVPWDASTYGTCQYPLIPDEDQVCEPVETGYFCDEQTAATWWYLYDYEGYSASSLWFFFGCYPSDYQATLKVPEMPGFKPKDTAIEAQYRLPYKLPYRREEA
jgi:hypothetical protein